MSHNLWWKARDDIMQDDDKDEPEVQHSLVLGLTPSHGFSTILT